MMYSREINHEISCIPVGALCTESAHQDQLQAVAGYFFTYCNATDEVFHSSLYALNAAQLLIVLDHVRLLLANTQGIKLGNLDWIKMKKVGEAVYTHAEQNLGLSKVCNQNFDAFCARIQVILNTNQSHFLPFVQNAVEEMCVDPDFDWGGEERFSQLIRAMPTIGGEVLGKALLRLYEEDLCVVKNLSSIDALLRDEVFNPEQKEQLGKAFDQFVKRNIDVVKDAYPWEGIQLTDRIKAYAKERFCLTCFEKKAKKELLKCSGCFLVYYCNTTCQRKSWRRHRPLCNKYVVYSGAESLAPLVKTIKTLCSQQAKTACYKIRSYRQSGTSLNTLSIRVDWIPKSKEPRRRCRRELTVLSEDPIREQAAILKHLKLECSLDELS